MNPKHILALAAALLALGAAPDAGSGAGGCIADWSVAARIVEKEALATVEAVTEELRARNAGSVVKTMLCQSGGSYVYRLTVKDANGALKNMTIDARGGR